MCGRSRSVTIIGIDGLAANEAACSLRALRSDARAAAPPLGDAYRCCVDDLHVCSADAAVVLVRWCTDDEVDSLDECGDRRVEVKQGPQPACGARVGAAKKEREHEPAGYFVLPFTIALFMSIATAMAHVHSHGSGFVQHSRRHKD